MTLNAPRRRPRRRPRREHEQPAPGTAPAPHMATDEEVAALEQAATFWSDPKTKAFIAEKARQERGEKKRERHDQRDEKRDQ